MTPYYQEWLSIVSRPREALLVDDSKEDTEIILSLSKDFNIKWEVAYTGKHALDYLSLKKYQLVVMDLHLHSEPEGVELFRQIKLACPTCPVLILSGHITNDVAVEVTRIGFAMFAQKPSVFSSEFFEQLFMALNIPKKPGKEGDPSVISPGGCI